MHQRKIFLLKKLLTTVVSAKTLVNRQQSCDVVNTVVYRALFACH